MHQVSYLSCRGMLWHACHTRSLSRDAPNTCEPALQVIRSLVQRRREVKKLLGNERDPTRRQQLDIRQQALKLTANSMQGPLSLCQFLDLPLRCAYPIPWM